MIHYKI